MPTLVAVCQTMRAWVWGISRKNRPLRVPPFNVTTVTHCIEADKDIITFLLYPGRCIWTIT